MTADELRAIRERNEERTHPFSKSSIQRFLADPYPVEWRADWQVAAMDVHALLAEVDRLRHLEGVIADLETRHGDGAECCADPPCKIGEVMKVVRSYQATQAPCCITEHVFGGGLKF